LTAVTRSSGSTPWWEAHRSAGHCEQAKRTEVVLAGVAVWNLSARQICRSRALNEWWVLAAKGIHERAQTIEGVCCNMPAEPRHLWPMPVTLDVAEEFAKPLKPGKSKIAPARPEGVMLAMLHVEEVWQPDRKLRRRRSSTRPALPILVWTTC